ncbi:MAG: aldolase/citrate lyase family protein [Chloroflexota bacterium]|nr:aldolase/citrate lyase family protein [Chloroflexota bacterium]
MRKNKIKQVMQSNQLALGAYVGLADPQIVEIIGIAGFDAAFIDMEHTAFDLSLVQQMIIAAELVGISPIVRVSDSDPGFILRVLDMGAQGIVIPHVDGLEGAKEAVDAVRYAPIGTRGGAGGTRAASFGDVSWADHVRTSNDEILLSVMTEDAKAIEQVPEIAALDGVDLVALGPTDLSQTLGVTDPSDPKLRNEVERIANEVKQAGNAKLQIPMNHPAFPLGPDDLVRLGVGYTHVAPPPPAILMREMKKSIASIHEALGRSN